MAEGDGQQIGWIEELSASLKELHDAIIAESGGMLGEHSSFLGACARPFHSVFGKDAFPSTYEKAAALFHGIICDHVFVDGNKRTATVATIWLLSAFDLMERPPSKLQVRMLGEVALETADTGLTVQEVTFWLHRIFD